jgi:hypothetical protein
MDKNRTTPSLQHIYVSWRASEKFELEQDMRETFNVTMCLGGLIKMQVLEVLNKNLHLCRAALYSAE